MQILILLQLQIKNIRLFISINESRLFMILKTFFFVILCIFIVFGIGVMSLTLKINPIVMAPLFVLILFIPINSLLCKIFSNLNTFSIDRFSYPHLEKSWFVQCVIALVILQWINLGKFSENNDVSANMILLRRIDLILLISLGFFTFMLYKLYLEWRQFVKKE